MPSEKHRNATTTAHWTNSPSAFLFFVISLKIQHCPTSRPQSSKSNLVLPTHILGPFGPPKNRENFDICNKRPKWVFCDSVDLTPLSFPVQIQFCRPLHCLVISTLWSPRLSKLISCLVHQLFGPPHMCAVCGDFEDRVIYVMSSFEFFCTNNLVFQPTNAH